MAPRTCAAVLLALAALGAPLTAAGAAPASGWRREVVADAGLAIAIPASWTPIPIAHTAPAAGSPAAGGAPWLADMAGIALKNDLLKFAAVGLDGGSPLDMSIIELTARDRHEIGLRAQLSSAFLESGLSPSAVHETPVALPAGRAQRLTLTVDVLGTRMQITDFVFTHDGAQIQVSFAASAAATPSLAATVRRSIGSLRYLR